jgi:hypothetical protein
MNHNTRHYNNQKERQQQPKDNPRKTSAAEAGRATVTNVGYDDEFPVLSASPVIQSPNIPPLTTQVNMPRLALHHLNHFAF